MIQYNLKPVGVRAAGPKIFIYLHIFAVYLLCMLLSCQANSFTKYYVI